MARSSRAEIRQTIRRVQPRKSPREMDNRRGVGKPTLRDARRSNPDNYRDLSDCVRHLTYHVFPVAESLEAVMWNLNQLQRRWHLFNGMKVIGINHDATTITPDALLGLFAERGMIWDHVIVRPNSGLGEVLTWVPSLELLSPETAGPNEVVFSAHAKGVKYGPMPPIIRKWNEVMYSVNLDDWDLVRESLEWYVATGAFRARGARVPFCRHAWYYSGAFWWWRLADLGQRDWCDVGQWYPGREVWIGHHVERHETDCLFMDRSRSPYNPSYWQRTVNSAWAQFKQQHGEKINAQ